MGKGSWINGIITILILASGTILGLGIYSYIETNAKDKQGETIQILERVPAAQEENTTSYPIETLEAAGATTLPTQSNATFHGTKYYYHQLDDYAKIVYESFEKNIENLKTGTYQIEFDNEFNELLKQENGNNVLNDEFQRAWDAFSYDRPDVFYLDPNKFSITVETNRRALKTTYRVYINKGNHSTYLSEGFTGKEQIDQYVKQLELLKKQFIDQMSTMSDDYEKIKALHDWIVDNMEYDTTMQHVHRYNIYGALVDRNVVCEGYAKLFKYILDEMKIECVLASGDAINSEGQSERHMWNYVKLNGGWYAVDCTWDDPIIVGGGKITKDMKYRYFLKGDSFYQDHTEEPITDKSENLTYPKLSEQDYKN